MATGGTDNQATGGTDNQKINVMSVNIGLKRRERNPDESREEAINRTIEIKNDAISELLEAQKPDIVFMQESKKTDKIPTNFEYRFNGQASLLYNTGNIELNDVKSGVVDAIIQKVSESDQTKEIVKARMSLAIAKTKEVPEVKFLCVSWHAPHKKIKESNEKALVDMVSFVDALCTELELECVIGGDFNLPFDEVVSFLKKANLDYKAEKYKLLPRRERLIDFFLTSKNLEVTDVTAVAWNSLSKIKEKLDDFFDHDPVVGCLMKNKIASDEDEDEDSRDPEEEDSQRSEEDEVSQRSEEEVAARFHEMKLKG